MIAGIQGARFAIVLVLALLIAGIWWVLIIKRERPVAEKPYEAGSVTSRDGTVIVYRQYGKGPGLVLLHGGMMSSQDFTQLASMLFDDFTVYVPDRRGRALSGPHGPDYSIQKEVDDISALLSKTSAHNVFGLSYGGIIALEAGRRLPQIDKVAAYEPPLPLKGQESTLSWLNRYDHEMDQGNLGAALITVARGTGDSSFLTKLPRFIAEPFMNFAIQAQAREMKPDEAPLLQLIPTMHNEAQVVAGMKGEVNNFSNMRSRVLLLRGTKGPENLHAPVDVLADIIPEAKRYVFPGADHLAAANGERPRMVANRLRRFFKEP